MTPWCAPYSQKQKISRKREFFGRTSLWTSGQKLRSGPPNPGGCPRKNFGLKNFGLTFRSVYSLRDNQIVRRSCLTVLSRCAVVGASSYRHLVAMHVLLSPVQRSLSVHKIFALIVALNSDWCDYVAQCSATPASVAATPPVARHLFRGSFTCDTSGSSRATGATGPLRVAAARYRCYT